MSQQCRCKNRRRLERDRWAAVRAQGGARRRREVRGAGGGGRGVRAPARGAGGSVPGGPRPPHVSVMRPPALRAAAPSTRA